MRKANGCGACSGYARRRKCTTKRPMSRSTIAPSVASAIERMLKPVALTAPHPKWEPIQPPSIEPTMPRAMVMRQPAGSRPGIRYFESEPAIRPRMIQWSQRGMQERNEEGNAHACRASGPGVVSCHDGRSRLSVEEAKLPHVPRVSCPPFYFNALHTVGWSAVSADRGRESGGREGWGAHSVERGRK